MQISTHFYKYINSARSRCTKHRREDVYIFILRGKFINLYTESKYHEWRLATYYYYRLVQFDGYRRCWDNNRWTNSQTTLLRNADGEFEMIFTLRFIRFGTIENRWGSKDYDRTKWADCFCVVLVARIMKGQEKRRRKVDGDKGNGKKGKKVNGTHKRHSTTLLSSSC